MKRKNRIVRVTKEEFELSDGSVYPIVPPLSSRMTKDEFQRHYDNAVDVAGCLETFRVDNKDIAGNGP